MINTVKLLASEALYKLNYPLSETGNDEIVEGIKDNGCFVIDSFLDKDTCEALVKKATSFIEQNPEKLKVESNGSDIRVYGIDRYTDEFYIPEVKNISDNIFNRFTYKVSSDNFLLLGKITSSSENLGSGSGWHRDAPFAHQFKTILYLTDVTQDNGPFQYIKKSNKYSEFLKANRHLGKELNDYRFSNDEIEKLVEDGILEKPVSITGPAGTLLFADTRGLHRGAPLNDGERIAITNYYFTKKVDEKKFFVNA